MKTMGMSSNSVGRSISLLLILFTAAALSGCVDTAGFNEPSDVRSDAGSSDAGSTDAIGTTYTACGQLNVIWSSGPRNVFAWPEGNTYGVNAFYAWEIDFTGTPDAPHYFWKGTTIPVANKLPYNNWQVPTTLWSAIRFALDGNDPYHFSLTDMFVMGYVPFVSGVGSSWMSENGATNDGKCPESNYMQKGWDHCYGNKQQDSAAPKTLVDGKAYLLMMGMIVPLGTDKAGYKLNRVQSCYMNTFIAQGWGPQGD